jgi:hypothetical protein|nr:MAG TPA: hypothetical protein [Caudoviricetes sp.]
MPAAGSPAAGQSASGRASKQEAGRAAGDQIKQDGGFCSLVLVRCVIFFCFIPALWTVCSLLGYPRPRTHPSHRARGHRDLGPIPPSENFYKK